MVRPAPIAALLLMACAAPALAADFTAEVDRRELYVNEHVLLTLSLSDSDTRLRAEGVAPNVDLTVLTGQFDLGVPRSDFRFNINRNRGRSTSIIAVELFPRAPGRLRIPAFTIDGLSTAPIELRVLPLPPDAAPEVFARSGIARGRLHAREQTLLYLDLYHRVELAGARLGGPLDSRPRSIEAHALPAEERSERVGGVEYRVTRTAWAVSPTAEGEVALLLPDIWVETRQGRQWRLPFGEERIEVQALPEGLPAATLIGRPQVEQDDPGPATAGQALPWQLVLRSGAALNALPAEAPLAPPASGLRVYMDPPERRLETLPGGGVESVAVYRGHLLAEAPGDYSTPAIRLPYYDADAGTAVTLEIPGRPFSAAPAPSGPGPVAIPAGPTAAQTGSLHGPWPWLALAFALLWIATLALLWRRLRGAAAPTAGRTPRGSRAGDPGDPKGRLLAALGSRTLEEGLQRWQEAHGRDTGVEQAIRRVQRLCYRPEGGTGAAELTVAVEHALARLEGRTAHPDGKQAETEDPWSPRAFRPGRAYTHPSD